MYFALGKYARYKRRFIKINKKRLKILSVCTYLAYSGIKCMV